MVLRGSDPIRFSMESNMVREGSFEGSFVDCFIGEDFNYKQACKMGYAL